jgi:hypothetical protein
LQEVPKKKLLFGGVFKLSELIIQGSLEKEDIASTNVFSCPPKIVASG